MVYLAHSQHERIIGDVAPGTIQREMRQIIAWYAPTPTFARAGSRCGGERENMRSCRYCKAFVVFFVIKSFTLLPPTCFFYPVAVAGFIDPDLGG